MMAPVPDYQSKTHPPEEITRYVRTWREYRKRCWITFALLGAFPLVVVALIAFQVAGVGVGWIAALFFGWGIAIGVSDWWRNNIRCPRCGQCFFRRRGSVTGNRCRSCGLPKWATYNVPRED